MISENTMPSGAKPCDARMASRSFRLPAMNESFGKDAFAFSIAVGAISMPMIFDDGQCACK